MYCSITVKGHLDARWSAWFDGLTITNLENGETALAGRLPDQAALHGALTKVRDLGLPLISVRCEDRGACPRERGCMTDLTRRTSTEGGKSVEIDTDDTRRMEE
jgi:hypothetical protein